MISDRREKLLRKLVEAIDDGQGIVFSHEFLTKNKISCVESNELHSEIAGVIESHLDTQRLISSYIRNKAAVKKG